MDVIIPFGNQPERHLRTLNIQEHYSISHSPISMRTNLNYYSISGAKFRKHLLLKFLRRIH